MESVALGLLGGALGLGLAYGAIRRWSRWLRRICRG